MEELDQQLIKAVGYNRIEEVKELLDKGADIHALNDEILAWASHCDNYDLVKLLVDRGADIHADSERALICASACGRYESVKLFLEKGADVHCRDDRALYVASKGGHYTVVKLLLENGANPNVPVPYENRMIARSGENGLVEYASDDHQNQVPLFYAAYKGYYDVVEILKEYMENSICFNIMTNFGR